MTKVSCPTCSKPILECRRYRLEPLAEYMRLSMSATCIAVRLSGTTQRDARCHGVTRKVVDRIADQLRVHPSEIWSEVIDHDIEDASTPCEECGERFIPFRRGQRWCSNRCRNRRRQRELYRTDPDYRAKKRAKAAVYYREVGDYARAYDRRRNRDTDRAATRRQRYQNDPDVRERRLESARRAKAKNREAA